MARGDYTIQAVKGIKESFANGAKAMIDQYKGLGLADIYSTPETFEIFTSNEGLTGAKELSDAETPATSQLEQGYSVQIETKRFGSSITVNEREQVDGKDNTLKVDEYLREQRDQAIYDNHNLFIRNMHDFYNYAFATTKYASPDAVALCASHSWNTPDSDAWDNSTTDALSTDAIDTLEEYGGDFVDAAGKPMPVTFSHIVVKKGSDNARTAKRLFANGINPTQINDINLYEGTYNIIETPYITTANKNYWFALALNGAWKHPLIMGVTEYPTMREPQVLENEAVRSNITGFWKQGIRNLPIGIYGSDGTGS
jgi:hypothetical protein